MNTGKPESEPDFDPSHYRLEDPWLNAKISHANIEFDCAIRGKTDVGFESVKTVIRIVRHFAGSDSEYKSPIAVTLVAQASQDVRCAESKDVNVLIAAALDLLSHYAEEAYWEKLRDFCVALGNRFLAHRQEDWSSRNQYQYPGCHYLALTA
jgi:hypothetical protein